MLFPNDFDSMAEIGIPETPSADLDARAEKLEAVGTSSDPYLEGIMSGSSKADQVGKVLTKPDDEVLPVATFGKQPYLKSVVVISHINSHGKMERQHVLSDMDKVADFMAIAYKDFCKGEEGIWVCCYDHVIVQEHIIK